MVRSRSLGARTPPGPLLPYVPGIGGRKLRPRPVGLGDDPVPLFHRDVHCHLRPRARDGLRDLPVDEDVQSFQGAIGEQLGPEHQRLPFAQCDLCARIRTVQRSQQQRSVRDEATPCLHRRHDRIRRRRSPAEFQVGPVGPMVKTLPAPRHQHCLDVHQLHQWRQVIVDLGDAIWLPQQTPGQPGQTIVVVGIAHHWHPVPLAERAVPGLAPLHEVADAAIGRHAAIEYLQGVIIADLRAAVAHARDVRVRDDGQAALGVDFTEDATDIGHTVRGIV